jgi:mitogen-activated protein kinase kinase kinase ANP1
MGSCVSKGRVLQGKSDVDPLPEPVLQWKQGALIGEGAYGKVYQCLNLETGELHAVKHISLEGTHEQICHEVMVLKKEICLLRSLCHRNIVKYLYTEVNEEFTGVDIVMEYVSGGSLQKLIKRFGHFPEPMAALYIGQVLEGLRYLHGEGIIHRDIKSANILVSHDGVIKLSDFGASKKLAYDYFHASKQKICRSLKGSPYWMAPEIARRTGHSFSADIWSVGCVMIEMLSGQVPWSNESSSAKEVLRVIRSGRTPTIPEEISPECKEFIMQCLEIDAEKRPSAKLLLDHAFLKVASHQNIDNTDAKLG